MSFETVYEVRDLDSLEIAYTTIVGMDDDYLHKIGIVSHEGEPVSLADFAVNFGYERASEIVKRIRSTETKKDEDEEDDDYLYKDKNGNYIYYDGGDDDGSVPYFDETFDAIVGSDTELDVE